MERSHAREAESCAARSQLAFKDHCVDKSSPLERVQSTSKPYDPFS